MLRAKEFKSRSNIRQMLTKFSSLTVGELLLFVFIFNVVFIPNDTLDLKIISLLILLTISIPQIINVRTKDEKIVVFFGLFLTAFTILWSIFLTRNIIVNISMGYPGFILLLYLYIKRKKVNFGKILISTLTAMAYFVVFIALLDILKIYELTTNPLIMWFAETSNAMVGKGPDLPIYYMIFMKTSPLMFLSLIYCLQSHKYISSIITAIALILSGTRADIIMVIGTIFIYACFLQKNRDARKFSILFSIFILLVVVIDGRVIDAFIDIFTRKAGSDAVRTGHLDGMIAFWKENPIKIFTGAGYSSQFYSFGTNSYLSSVELSYWNLLRQLGIILFAVMMVMYLYPALKLLRARKCYSQVLAYCVYLIIAYTNPLLYSSTGMIIMLYMYWLCLDQNIWSKRKDLRRNDQL